jgi:hypothetical protein
MAAYQLAWWLRRHRISAQVIEYVQLLTTAELIELSEPFISEKTLAIALPLPFWPPDGSIPTMIAGAIRYFREKYPKLEVVVGGGRPDRSEYRDAPFTKRFPSGYAEDGFLKWCQEKKSGVAMLNPLFDITRLDHRFIKEDVIMPGEVLPLELGRGCIFRCKFCNYPNIGKKKSTYQRHFDCIVDEMRWNQEQFGTTQYMLLDDTVNEDVEKVKNLGTLPKVLGFKPGWVGYLRADLIHRFPETADHLRESGLVSCFFGLESLHPEASKSIGKAWSGKHAKQYIPHLHKNIWGGDINMWCNYIIGLPGEPMSSYFETLRWCKENPVGFHNFYELIIKPHFEHDDIKSVIDKDPAAHGYTITDENTGAWKGHGTTSEAARMLAGKFNTTLEPLNRPAGYETAQFLNCGLTIERLRVTPRPVAYRIMESSASFKARYLKEFRKVHHEHFTRAD